MGIAGDELSTIIKQLSVNLRCESTLSAPMASLLDLSHELLHCVLVHVEPADLAKLSRTCRSLNAFISHNTLLCKDLYLQRWVGEHWEL